MLLQVTNLTKRFAQVLANDNICFEVAEGEIHCLLGENGAGKTTLAECIYGFYRNDDGTVKFNGETLSISSPNDAIRHGIGMVHQHLSLVEAFSVLENVLLGAQTSGVRLERREVGRRLQELCDIYEVDMKLDARIWQLSVGEQQWVEILKALYAGVKLLILDEPTAVLTPQESDRLFTVLQRMKEDGLSIIFITHKMKEVMAVSDRVTVLRKGRVVNTVSTNQTTMEDLAQMMVGREVVFRVHAEETSIGRPILEIKGLHAMGNMGTEALQGVDLTLHGGEILGIAGVAGNGQRELFEVLTGVRRPTAGTIHLYGRSISNCTPRERISMGIGYVPDDRIKVGLVPNFSVSENLILGRHREGLFRTGLFFSFVKIKQFAEECIDHFEIATPSFNHTTRFLSGGNLQKVILARELSRDLRVLLANQPTRGLDVGAAEYVLHQLLEIRKEGVGVLLASEDLEQLISLSDRIAVMFNGKIMKIINAKDVNLPEIGLLMAGIRNQET